jgi:hypothetical protein
MEEPRPSSSSSSSSSASTFTFQHLKDIVARSDIEHWLNMLDSENVEPVVGFWDQIDRDVAIVLHPDGELVAVSLMWVMNGIVPQTYNDAH